MRWWAARRARFDRLIGVSITVADTGIGIAPEHLDRVIEPFTQVDSALSREHDGTGLGLPVVKANMELHQGRIELWSNPGCGTEATIIFPASRAISSRLPDSRQLLHEETLIATL
jgi:signal transduction histidine kinase